MSMLLILREEILSVMILLFLILYYIFNKVKDKEMLFLRLAIISLIHVIFDIITVITVNHLEVVPNSLNCFLHVCFYISGMLFAITFYRYVRHLSAASQAMHHLETVGYIILAIFSVMLFFLPMEYVKGRGTNYSYSLLTLAGYALFLLYNTISLVTILRIRKQLDSRVRWSIIPIILMMYAAIIIQAIIPELLMTGGNVTLVCIGTFVALDNPDKDFMKQALWDFTTGLKNRNSYNRDLNKYIVLGKGIYIHKQIGFVVADLNYLKVVNDNHGHAEGDRLLSAAATALRENLRSASEVYRLGGDEFVAIYLSPKDDLVHTEIQQVRAACLKDTSHAVPLSVAIGYASGPLNDSVDAIFQQADQSMYENKRQIKQELGISDGR